MQSSPGCVGSPGYVTSGRRWHRRIPFFTHDPGQLIDIHGRSGASRTLLKRTSMAQLGRLVSMLSLVALTSACATSLRSPHVADIRYNPGRYQNQTVSINGVVTNSWGGPFIPVSYYKIDDGTGEMTVLSQGGRRLPSRG